MSLVKSKSSSNGDRFPSVFSDFFNRDKFFGSRLLDTWQDQAIPAVNIKEDNKTYKIELVAPGFAREDLKVDVDNDILTISAEKREEKSDGDGDGREERFTRREYSYSSFSRSFTLPQNSTADKIDAKYENGVLKLTLPKKEESQPNSRKQIQIR
jgi:HSP20 family protein